MTAHALPPAPSRDREGEQKVRGKLTPEAPLAPLVWFKSGGRAQWLFEPADADDLAQFLRNLEPDVPVLALGLGSNMIVRDGGVPGVVVRLGKTFAKIGKLDDVTLRRRGERHPGVLDRARRGHRRPRIPARHSGHRRRLRPHERRCLRPRSEGHIGLRDARPAQRRS
jgi:hypothetical protein